MLEYSKWKNFNKVIDKAKVACEKSNKEVLEHFPNIRKLSKRANGDEVIIGDYKLLRH